MNHTCSGPGCRICQWTSLGSPPVSIQEVGTAEESCCPTPYWCTASGPTAGVQNGQTWEPPPGALSGPYESEEKALLACPAPPPEPPDPNCTPKVCGQPLWNTNFRLDLEIMSGLCGQVGAARNGLLMTPRFNVGGCVEGYEISAIFPTPAGTMIGVIYRAIWYPGNTSGIPDSEFGAFLYDPACGITADIFTGQTCRSAIQCDAYGFQGYSFFQAETADSVRLRIYRDGTVPPPYCTP